MYFALSFSIVCEKRVYDDSGFFLTIWQFTCPSQYSCFATAENSCSTGGCSCIALPNTAGITCPTGTFPLTTRIPREVPYRVMSDFAGQSIQSTAFFPAESMYCGDPMYRTTEFQELMLDVNRTHPLNAAASNAILGGIIVGTASISVIVTAFVFELMRKLPEKSTQTVPKGQKIHPDKQSAVFDEPKHSAALEGDKQDMYHNGEQQNKSKQQIIIENTAKIDAQTSENGNINQMDQNEIDVEVQCQNDADVYIDESSSLSNQIDYDDFMADDYKPVDIKPKSRDATHDATRPESEAKETFQAQQSQGLRTSKLANDEEGDDFPATYDEFKVILAVTPRLPNALRPVQSVQASRAEESPRASFLGKAGKNLVVEDPQKEQEILEQRIKERYQKRADRRKEQPGELRLFQKATQ